MPRLSDLKSHELIKTLRLRQGWSQRDLAIRLNMSPQLISNLERGVAFMPEKRVGPFCGLVDFDPRVLFKKIEKERLRKRWQRVGEHLRKMEMATKKKAKRA